MQSLMICENRENSFKSVCMLWMKLILALGEGEESNLGI